MDWSIDTTEEFSKKHEFVVENEIGFNDLCYRFDF